MEKTRQLDADVFILDLEDSVAPQAKDEAREQVRRFLEARADDSQELVVRVNGLDTPWCEADLLAIARLAPDAVLFPKINSAADVRRAEALLRTSGAGPEQRLWCTIETALAILNLHPIAQLAGDSAMSAWVIGTNDLVKELHAAHTPERSPLLYALSSAVMAARAYGLVILDGVHNDIADEEGLARSCEQALALGFDGKTLIHPAQVALCNRVFSPDPQSVLQANKIIAAFALPENAGKGALQIDGRMVELLHAEAARDTLAIAAAIAAREAARR